MHRRSVLVLPALVLFALLVSCFRKPDDSKPPVDKGTESPPSPVTDLDVGLTPEETLTWRYTSEGSDLVPVDLLRALIDVNTGRPFAESMDRYGFIPSPAGPENPYGLPVGWSVGVPEYAPRKLDFVGLNCAACHTGQLEYGGQTLRIDGAPNMADLESFALAARDSTVDMLKNPVKAFLFVWRLVHLEPPEHASPQETFAGQLPDDTRDFLAGYAAGLPADASGGASAGGAPGEIMAAGVASAAPTDPLVEEMGANFARILNDEPPVQAAPGEVMAAGIVDDTRDKIRQVYEFVEKLAALLRNRIELGVRAIHAFETSPVAGPGRDDPWGIIRNLVFLSETPLTAPNTIPHLFYARQFIWIHADGNTNSVMQRNLAQAIALGAYVNPETDESTLKPRNIWALEDMLDKLRSPAWPESVFGPIDTEKAARGKALFERKMPGPGGGQFSCADCHAAFNGKLINLDVVGTDPNRAKNFLRPQDGKPFADAIYETVSELEAFVYQKAGITPEEAREHEYADPPEWRGTGKYLARRLDGLWPTAPFLHNASVPTLYDLLLPVDQRPSSFPVGHRDYDPAKVGYTTDVAEPVFVFDTSADGNSNAGHEFGTTLSDAERWDLVEYLKTL